MLKEPRAELPACLDDDRRMNVIQLIALCAALGLSSAVAARYSGAGWGASLLISWATTIIGVFGLTGLIFLVEALVQWRRSGLAPPQRVARDDDPEDRTSAEPPAAGEAAKAEPEKATTGAGD